MTIDVEALIEAVGLKALARTGWVRRGIAGPESVAAHSWGVAWLALALLPPELDRERALVYAVLHDLPEVRAGDLTPSDGVAPADKARREHAAINGLCASLPHLAATWRTYEAQADPEARFVRQLDRLDMAIQAVAYERAGHGRLDDFFASAGRVIEHPALVGVFEAVVAARP